MREKFPHFSGFLSLGFVAGLGGRDALAKTHAWPFVGFVFVSVFVLLSDVLVPEGPSPEDRSRKTP